MYANLYLGFDGQVTTQDKWCPLNSGALSQIPFDFVFMCGCAGVVFVP